MIGRVCKQLISVHAKEIWHLLSVRYINASLYHSYDSIFQGTFHSRGQQEPAAALGSD